MRIQVLTYFQGRQTNENWIGPGIYEVGDPALFGIEEFLVYNQGKAVYLPDDPDTSTEDLHPVPPRRVPPPPPLSDPQYEGWSLIRLQAEIMRRGLVVRHRHKGRLAKGKPLKTELIAALVKQDRNLPLEEPEPESGLKRPPPVIDEAPPADLDVTGRPRVKQRPEG